MERFRAKEGNVSSVWEFVRALVFFLGLLLLLVAATSFFQRGLLSNIPWYRFSRLPKESIDVLFVGNSHSAYTFFPDELEKSDGISAFNLSPHSINTAQKLSCLRQALKTQMPKVVVLEIYGFARPTKNLPAGFTAMYPYMPLGKEKIKSLLQTAPREYALEYLVSLTITHDRWQDMTGAYFRDYFFHKDTLSDSSRGAIYGDSPSAEQRAEMNSNLTKTTVIEVPKKQMKENLSYVHEFADECSRNGIELILVGAPTLNKGMTSYFPLVEDSFRRELQSGSVWFVDMNEHFTEIGLTVADFSDAGHLARGGGVKSTQWFSREILLKTTAFAQQQKALQ